MESLDQRIPSLTRHRKRKTKRKTKRKRKGKSNKTRRKYNRRKKIKKRRKTKRVIKGGGKKFNELLAEIYLNRDMILGHYPKPLTEQEAHNLTVATEESMYDAFPVNNDPNQDRIRKYMIDRKFWHDKKRKSKNSRNKMMSIPIADYDSYSDTPLYVDHINSPRTLYNVSKGAASLAAGL